MKKVLMKKIENKMALIGVIGLGYVGLPLLLEFAKKGFKVVGFDVDTKKVTALKRSMSYIKHIKSDTIKKQSRNFRATTDFSKLRSMDIIIICVPTPLSRHRDPDMTYVFSATENVLKYLKKGQLVVLESTTYPGTTDQDMRAILERSGLRAGKDFHLAFSPEREDPNNMNFSTATIPKIVGGYTPDCLKAAKALYDSIVVKTVPVSSTRVAEAAKLLENIYRAVNIALVNEMKMLFDKMDINIWEVIDAAKTKPFGFQPFYPGPGLGGHCIPIDPFYLTWKAKEYDVTTKFIELAGEINTSMPHYVVQKTIDTLNGSGKSILGSKVLVLGLAYKKDIDDIRESPSLKLIALLQQKGAIVCYNDPYVKDTHELHCFSPKPKSVSLTAANLNRFDCVIISTDHTIYEPAFIGKHAKYIVDTRNIFKGHQKFRNKVKRA